MCVDVCGCVWQEVREGKGRRQSDRRGKGREREEERKKENASFLVHAIKWRAIQ